VTQLSALASVEFSDAEDRLVQNLAQLLGYSEVSGDRPPVAFGVQEE
jgi:hypothetical protein